MSEDFSTTHERALAFMGSFAVLANGMNTAIRIHLAKHSPDLAHAISDHLLTRVSDDKRLVLFQAFTIDTAYRGNLANFKQIYNRAKQVRDAVGHSLHIAGPVHSSNSAEPFVSLTVLRSTKTNLIPNPIYPSTFDRLYEDCKWMDKHVTRALYDARPEVFVIAPGAPSEPDVPGPLPINGEPL